MLQVCKWSCSNHSKANIFCRRINEVNTRGRGPPPPTASTLNKGRSSQISCLSRALSRPQGPLWTHMFRCSFRCVKKGSDGEAGGVDAGLCDQEEMPPRAQVCFLACPNDCVATAWGPWSSCPLVRAYTPDVMFVHMNQPENSFCSMYVYIQYISYIITIFTLPHKQLRNVWTYRFPVPQYPVYFFPRQEI